MGVIPVWVRLPPVRSSEYGEIGRRARLRIWCPKGRVGSTPSTPTMLDKAIEHGREHRKPFYGKRANFPDSCRPHGGCPVCDRNRLHCNNLREVIADEQLEDFYEKIDRVSAYHFDIHGLFE